MHRVACEDPNSLMRDPFLDVTEDGLSDVVTRMRRSQACLCKTRLGGSVRTNGSLVVTRKPERVASCTMHPFCGEERKHHALQAKERVTNPSSRALSVRITYSMPSSTISRCPLVMRTCFHCCEGWVNNSGVNNHTAISRILLLRGSRPVISQSIQTKGPA